MAHPRRTPIDMTAERKRKENLIAGSFTARIQNPPVIDKDKLSKLKERRLAQEYVARGGVDVDALMSRCQTATCLLDANPSTPLQINEERSLCLLLMRLVGIALGGSSTRAIPIHDIFKAVLSSEPELHQHTWDSLFAHYSPLTKSYQTIPNIDSCLDQNCGFIALDEEKRQELYRAVADMFLRDPLVQRLLNACVVCEIKGSIGVKPTSQGQVVQLLTFPPATPLPDEFDPFQLNRPIARLVSENEWLMPLEDMTDAKKKRIQSAIVSLCLLIYAFLIRAPVQYDINVEDLLYNRVRRRGFTPGDYGLHGHGMTRSFKVSSARHYAKDTGLLSSLTSQNQLFLDKLRENPLFPLMLQIGAENHGYDQARRCKKDVVNVAFWTAERIAFALSHTVDDVVKAVVDTSDQSHEFFELVPVFAGGDSIP